jgi:hypothetical protein
MLLRAFAFTLQNRPKHATGAHWRQTGADFQQCANRQTG